MFLVLRRNVSMRISANVSEPAKIASAIHRNDESYSTNSFYWQSALQRNDVFAR